MAVSRAREIRRERVRRAARYSRMRRWIQPRVAWPIAIGLLAVIVSFLLVGLFAIDAVSDIVRPYFEQLHEAAPPPP